MAGNGDEPFFKAGEIKSAAKVIIRDLEQQLQKGRGKELLRRLNPVFTSFAYEVNER